MIEVICWYGCFFSMDEIVVEIGVFKIVFYCYFVDKNDLMIVVMMWFM